MRQIVYLKKGWTLIKNLVLIVDKKRCSYTRGSSVPWIKRTIEQVET